MGVIDAERTKQMASPGLQEPAKKALATLDREWDGLVAHRDYPMISLDNNAAERALRRPVVTRKNAYGSRTEDAARLAATRLDHHRDRRNGRAEPLTYLTAYLDDLRTNRRETPDRAEPGTVPALDRHPRRPAHLGTTTPPRLTPPPTTSRRRRGKRSRRAPGMPATGLPNTYHPSAGFAALNYIDHDDPLLAIANSFNPKRPLPEVKLIFSGSIGSVFPRSAAIPVADARKALLEWLHTWKRPTCIEWRPYDAY